MDDAYITGVRLLLIPVDFFRLAWSNPCARQKSSWIKQIIRVIFSRNGIPKTLVSDNAPEFCDEDLNLWLEKIECRLSYHPQSNGLVERMVQTVKKETKSTFSGKRKKEVFLPRMLLSNRTIPHAGRLENPSALIGKQIRAPQTMSHSTNEKIWYKKNKESNPERAEFITQKGYNTVIINREKENNEFVHPDQIRTQGDYEEQNDEEISTIPSVNDLLEQPLQNETSEDEIMHDQVGQNEFENSDEDPIMQEDNPDNSSVRDRSRFHIERNTGVFSHVFRLFFNKIQWDLDHHSIVLQLDQGVSKQILWQECLL